MRKEAARAAAAERARDEHLETIAALRAKLGEAASDRQTAAAMRERQGMELSKLRKLEAELAQKGKHEQGMSRQLAEARVQVLPPLPSRASSPPSLWVLCPPLLPRRACRRRRRGRRRTARTPRRAACTPSSSRQGARRCVAPRRARARTHASFCAWTARNQLRLESTMPLHAVACLRKARVHAERRRLACRCRCPTRHAPCPICPCTPARRTSGAGRAGGGRAARVRAAQGVARGGGARAAAAARAGASTPPPTLRLFKCFLPSL